MRKFVIMRFFAFVLLLFVFASCKESTEHEVQKNVPENFQEEKRILLDSDTSLDYRFQDSVYNVMIRFPEVTPTGTILLLQGWNFPNTDWCDSTTFCEKALDKGYILICPYMGKSIYQKRNYEHTRSDYKQYPTRDWLRNVVLKDLNDQFHLFEVYDNFVVGLSTGGRGALLMAMDQPEMFTAGASLSGDYDQSAYPDDYLYGAYFGTNPDDWREDENPASYLASFEVPMYIGHGMKDPVVPYGHFTVLKAKTDSLCPETQIVYHTDSLAKHNYSYWNSEVDNILNFFGSVKH